MLEEQGDPKLDGRSRPRAGLTVAGEHGVSDLGSVPKASLATTLMAVIVIFRAGDGTLSVMPASEYDGDSAAIVDEIDPFAP